MASKFSKDELHQMFVDDLGDRVVWHSDIRNKTLLVDLVNPRKKLRVYLFNCTCPPGGRALDEYKVQLIIEGQKRGERGHLDNSDDRFVVVAGLASPFSEKEDGVYVMWDPAYHSEFAYSANLQCYLDPMLQALSEDVVTCFKKGNKEEIVVAMRKNLSKAIEHRIDLDIRHALE